MLRIERFVVNPLAENCYVVSDETNECVIIDCGAYSENERKAVVDYIRGNGLKPVHLLQTHGHIDHCFGNDTIYKEFGLKPELHVNDEQLMNDLALQSQMILGHDLDVETVPVGRYLTENDVIDFGSHRFKIIETPGHSRGCVFYFCEEEKIAFSGDTLFRGSIGRTDFMGGSMFQIIQSLRMICQMSDDIRILPGHGEETTIGYECQSNMYLDR